MAKKITSESLLNIEPNKVPTDVKSYSTFIYGFPKTGKALDNNMIIPTPEGDKKVSDIKVGDYLFDRQGNPTKVEGVYPQGTLKAYKVTLSDKTSFIVNDEHIIPYVTSKKNINSKTLKEIMADYKQEVSSSFDDRPVKKHHKYKIPKSDAVHYSKKDLPLHPYALGVLIGDGALTCRYLTVSSSEQDVIERFMEKAGLDEYNKSKWNYDYFFQKRHNGTRPKEIQNIIADLGLNVKSINRFIPKEYLEGSISQRKELLAGLMDTDGSVHVNKTGSRRFGISTNSERLADDIKKLVLSLGYGCTLAKHSRNDELHVNDEYNVNIFTADNISKSNKHLQALSTRNDWYESKKELYTHIINIEEVEEREMTCFSVDNEEKLFLINDYIVTHNTTFVNDLYGERVIFIGTERRHDAVPGAMVVNVDSWGEFLQTMKALQHPEVHEKFDAICIDTTAKLESFCESFVLSSLDVDDLSDLPWGKGFSTYNKELEKGISLIEKSGYIPIFIDHAKKETKKVLVSDANAKESDLKDASVVKGDDGKQYVEYEKTVPSIKHKLFNQINRIVDNILFLDMTVDKNGIESRKIFYRDAPNHLAGSSFRNMPEYTELSAQAYEQAAKDAINNEGKNNIEEKQREQSKGATYDYNALMTEVAELGKKLQQDGKAEERNKVIENVLGKGRKVKDLDESQSEVLSVLVDELKEIS